MRVVDAQTRKEGLCDGRIADDLLIAKAIDGRARMQREHNVQQREHQDERARCELADALTRLHGAQNRGEVEPQALLALLIPRERDDDKRCAQKYGAVWDEYRRRVRWRIVPFVY